jgi:AcrR family transcriptional regulator
MSGAAIASANQVVKPSGQTATDTKTRILDAADEIFVRRGIDGARMQEIADPKRFEKCVERRIEES